MLGTGPSFGPPAFISDPRSAGRSGLLARIIHEPSVGLRCARRKTDEYAAKVAESLHYRLEAIKIGFPLFINKTRLRE
jgi:hypothetical protein